MTTPNRVPGITPSDSSPGPGRIGAAPSPFSDIPSPSLFTDIHTPTSEQNDWADEDAMDFICNRIMGYSNPDDSKHYVQKALEDFGYTNQVDFMALTDEEINNLKYTDDKGNLRSLIPGAYKKIMQTRNYLGYVIEQEGTASNNIWRDGIYDANLLEDG